MNKFELFKLLRHHIKLSDKRSPVFEQNKWAKGVVYFLAAMFIFYLILYGGIIGYAADGEAGTMCFGLARRKCHVPVMPRRRMNTEASRTSAASR